MCVCMYACINTCANMIVKLIMNVSLQILMNVSIEGEVVNKTVITPLALITAPATLDIDDILIGINV